MARDPKLEVGALNLRIPASHNRDYRALIQRIADLRRGVRVYGDSYVAIQLFVPEEDNLGVIAKYTEIDIDGDWFDLDDFDAATPERLSEINRSTCSAPCWSGWRVFFRQSLEPSLRAL